MALREIDGGPDYFSQFANSLPTDPGYFPIAVWFESVTSQADINLDRAAGLNTYVVITSDSNFNLIQSNGMYLIAQQDQLRNNATVQATAEGLIIADEIDMQQGPSTGYATLESTISGLPAAWDNHLLYNNYGKGVLFWETDAQAARFVNGTTSFGPYQHIVSADAYWFTDPNIDGASEGGRLLNNGQSLTEAQTRLAANYGYTVDRMRYLDGLDGEHMPVWGFVEVGWPFTETAAQGARAIEPEEIQAAVWHSIIAGARGVVYFNHSFGGPEQTQHALRDPAYAEERAAVAETNALIEQLAPVLNSPFDDGFVTVGPSVRAMAHYYNGEHYVFSGSTQHAASAPTFTFAGITTGTAIVIDENRTIPITNGQFSDTFADGNAIHIYHITTDGTPTPTPGSVSIDDVTISEGNSGTRVATFTATRSGGTAAFDVNFATSNATATVADSDYVAASDTLHFGANENTQTISVTINGDTKVEANETFNVVLSNATNGATISDSQGVGTITNDDSVVIAGSVSIDDVTISEGNSGTRVATFTATRSGGTAAFDVNFATSNGTATVADSDYVAASNTLHFGANENTQTISVTINGDTKVEASETFNVVLSNATNGATISDSQGVGTITNDDSAVIAGSVSIDDVTISEGNSGTKVATFTATRSGGTAAFDVNFATSNGTATVADSDYVAASNTLHFGANENTQTISVTINGDTKVEASETFNVVLSNATNGATISDSQGVGTITNDDSAVIAGSVSINDVTISEGNSGTNVATFTATRSGGTAAFDVNFATSNATATVADSDYVAASNTLHFGANENTQTISVTINGDTKVEASETFNVVLSNATNGATISDSQGVGTITNDDGAPTANLVANGGFETGDFSGWMLSGNSNGLYIAPTAYPGEVHTGSYSAGLGGFVQSDGILRQSIATSAGQHYTLSYWILSDNDASTPINHFVARWNGQTLMAVSNAPNSGYQLYTFDVVGINGNSVLELAGYNIPDAWRLDDVTLTVVEAAVPAIFTSGADTVTLPLLGGTFNALGGDDNLAYTGGPVTIDGGTGIDTVDFSQFNSAVWVNLSYNGPEIRTQDRPDLSSDSWRAIGDLTNVENLVGTVYSDFLQGNNDGNDTLTGGGGADTFVFDHLGADSQHQHDVIVDFQPGVDRIDLAATRVTDFGDLFTFGNRYMEQVGNDVLIHTSVSADTSILLQNVQLASVTQSDFLF